MTMSVPTPDSGEDAQSPAEPHEGEEGELEPLAAEAIETLEQRGAAAFDSLLLAHPEHAEELRRRVAALSRLGLLELSASDWGESVGPYRVVRSLGSGGMGEVLLGEHAETGEQAAIKLGPVPQAALSPSHGKQTQRAAERFAREVRAVADLSHPSIVPIIEIGEHKGRAWFAMEFVDGVGLDRVLEAVRSSAVPPTELTGSDLAAAVPGAPSEAFGATWFGAIGNIVQQVAQALIEAHAAGVVHRDVKPSNILLSRAGGVQIVDFGLAHLEDMPTLTLSGEFAGTPYYVAPEQIENVRGGVDGRADVFSLGVTLYECAALERPFAGRTPVEVLSSITTREPEPLGRVAPHLPASLELLCAKALEKSPALRYGSMQEFSDDLGRLLQFRPLLAKPPSPPARLVRWARRRPWRAASTALGALLLLGAPIGLLIANSKIRAERDLVRDEARRNGMVVDHFVRHFDSSTESADADNFSRKLLDRGVNRLSGELSDEPRVKAALLHGSGRAYLELGRPADARPLLDRALGIWLREGVEASGERARVLADLARVHLAEDRPGIARDLASRALSEVNRSSLTMEVGQEIQITIASSSLALGEIEAARASLEQLRLDPAAEALSGDIARVWEGIGRRELESSDLPGAEDAYRRSLELLQRAWAPDGARLAVVHDGLANALEPAGPGSEAEAREHRARAARLRGLDGGSLGSSASTGLPFMREPSWAATYGAAFDDGVTALQAGRLDAARRRFVEALEMAPFMAVAAYNLACVESREGNLEAAVAWLDRARRAGFACTEARRQSIESDEDLAGVRASAAGQEVLARLGMQWSEAQGHTSRHGRASSEALDQQPPPLLVVIHDRGERALDVAAAGPWRDLADQLGATLLVPAAPFLVGATAADGAAWATDPRELWAKPRAFGQPVLDAVSEALEGGDVDRRAVWIAGSGVSAMLALDLLVENPGLFRRGWLVDPYLHGASGASSGSLARALGARLAVSISGAAPPAEAYATDAASFAVDVERWLRLDGGWRASLAVEGAWPLVSPQLLDWWQQSDD